MYEHFKKCDGDCKLGDCSTVINKDTSGAFMYEHFDKCGGYRKLGYNATLYNL
jgi:hypothetical protein